MKKILLVCLLSFISLSASAREVNDVKIADSVKLGDTTLQLNGAGTRSKLFIDIYVAALYVGTKTDKAADVLSDSGNKRVALHMLYNMGSRTLLDAFKKAIEANHNAAELQALEAKLNKFYAIFGVLSGINKGDVILLDYQPATGTKVTINGLERGVVDGADMNRALLKIWLGDKPVQDDLKKDMLGAS
jgi:hypothetical protein